MPANRQVMVQFAPSKQAGLRDMRVQVWGLKITSRPGASKYYALNHDELLDVVFDCDGTEVRARLIVKVICQLKGEKLRKHRIERATRRIARKLPVVIDCY